MISQYKISFSFPYSIQLMCICSYNFHSAFVSLYYEHGFWNLFWTVFLFISFLVDYCFQLCNSVGLDNFMVKEYMV